MANPPIIYRRRTPQESDGFYHPVSPQLYADHDEITTLEDCPFPLKTVTFKVVLFGRLKREPDGTFAVVEFTKSCGHVVQERIPFLEHVKDFDHYGTKFIGKDYSIKNWERRIEFFRANLPCEICQMARHAIWCYSIGVGSNSRKKSLERLRLILDYNYVNWSEFLDWDKVVTDLQATRYNSK